MKQKIEQFTNKHEYLTIAIIGIIGIALICGIYLICAHGNNVIFDGNRQVIDTQWRFNWAIIQLGNGELIEGEVTSWRDFDNSDMIQITLDNEITFMTHSSNIILCSKCP